MISDNLELIGTELYLKVLDGISILAEFETRTPGLTTYHSLGTIHFLNPLIPVGNYVFVPATASKAGLTGSYFIYEVLTAESGPAAGELEVFLAKHLVARSARDTSCSGHVRSEWT
jgi:hypothetical protein